MTVTGARGGDAGVAVAVGVAVGVVVGLGVVVGDVVGLGLVVGDVLGLGLVVGDAVGVGEVVGVVAGVVAAGGCTGRTRLGPVKWRPMSIRPIVSAATMVTAIALPTETRVAKVRRSR